MASLATTKAPVQLGHGPPRHASCRPQTHEGQFSAVVRSLRAQHEPPLSHVVAPACTWTPGCGIRGGHESESTHCNAAPGRAVCQNTTVVVGDFQRPPAATPKPPTTPEGGKFRNRTMAHTNPFFASRINAFAHVRPLSHREHVKKDSWTLYGRAHTCRDTIGGMMSPAQPYATLGP